MANEPDPAPNLAAIDAAVPAGLLRLAQSLNTAVDQDDIFAAVHHELGSIVAADGALVAIAEDDPSWVQTLAVDHNYRPGGVERMELPPEGLIAATMERRSTMVLDECAGDPLGAVLAVIGMHSACCIPLTHDDSVYGYFLATSKTAGWFDEERQTRLEQAASLMAGAIDRVRLVQTARARVREIEHLHRDGSTHVGGEVGDRLDLEMRRGHEATDTGIDDHAVVAGRPHRHVEGLARLGQGGHPLPGTVLRRPDEGQQHPTIGRRPGQHGPVDLVTVPGMARSNPYVDPDGVGWSDNDRRFFGFSAAVAAMVFVALAIVAMGTDASAAVPVPAGEANRIMISGEDAPVRIMISEIDYDPMPISGPSDGKSAVMSNNPAPSGY